MADFRAVILQALEDRYNAQISEAEATIKIYLEKPVAIGEHPQHVDEVDKLIEKIANAEEKIKILQEFKICMNDKKLELMLHKLKHYKNITWRKKGN